MAPLAKAAATKKKEILEKEWDTAAKKAVAASKAAAEAAAAKGTAAAFSWKTTAEDKSTRASSWTVSGFYDYMRGGGRGGVSGGADVTSLDEKENAVKVWLRKISLEQYSDGVVDFGYDSMEALLVTKEKEVTEMTEDVIIGMKKPHRTLFLNAWKVSSKPLCPRSVPSPRRRSDSRI